MSFAYIAAVLVPKLYPLTNEQEALIFGVLHGILIFFTVLAYYFVMHQLEELETVLSKSRLVYTLHSPQWEHVYIAVLNSNTIMLILWEYTKITAYLRQAERQEKILLSEDIQQNN